MAFDFNEARAIIEEAKKRGIIREAGSEREHRAPAPAAAPKASPDDKATGAVLPDWLKEGINRPSSSDRSESPMWRSE